MIKWTKQSEREVLTRRIFAVKDIVCYHPVKKINHDFFSLETLDWINVVSITEEGTFILVKQHRLGTDEITIETPGGLVEGSELPEATAARELREETGYEAGEIHLIKKLAVNPAILNNYIYIYYAAKCKKMHEQNLDLAEDIEVLTVTRDEIAEMIRNGTINHSIVTTAFFLYFLSPWSGLVEKDTFLSKLF